MKVLAYSILAIVVVGGALYLHEQVKTKPIQPDSSGIEYNTSTWDNSYFATSEAQTYAAFQPQAPAVPNTPYGWDTLQSQSDGGIIPPNSGMPTYAT
jgi:hypothetical protein